MSSITISIDEFAKFRQELSELKQESQKVRILEKLVESQGNQIMYQGFLIKNGDVEREDLIKRIAEANLRAYDERQKVNEARSGVDFGMDVTKLTAESTGVVAGIGLIVGGALLCIVPGGALAGVPMMGVGIAGTITGSVYMGKTGNEMAKTIEMQKLAKEQDLDLAYCEAHDLARGKEEVEIITKELTPLKVTKKHIYAITSKPKPELKAPENPDMPLLIDSDSEENLNKIL